MRSFKRRNEAPVLSEQSSPASEEWKRLACICLASDILSFPSEAASVQVTTIKHSFILRPGRVLVSKKAQNWRCFDLPANPSGLHPRRDNVFFSGDMNTLPAAVCGETPPSQAGEDAAAAGPRAGNSRCQRLCCPRPGPSSPAHWSLRFPCLRRSRGC